MNCIIVDDDLVAQKVLNKCLERIDFIKVDGIFSNGLDAYNHLTKKKADLLFLDVEMPEMSGLELAKSLQHSPQIILVTSKTEYAAEAFELNATDYIVKPVTIERVLKAVEKAKDLVERSSQIDWEDNDWFVKSGTKVIKISSSDILWIEALGDYITINMEDGKKHVVHSTMKKIEDKLPKEKFMRIHRSFIVRKNKITSIEENLIYIGEKYFPISRGYREEVKTRLSIF